MILGGPSGDSRYTAVGAILEGGCGGVALFFFTFNWRRVGAPPPASSASASAAAAAAAAYASASAGGGRHMRRQDFVHTWK